MALRYWLQVIIVAESVTSVVAICDSVAPDKVLWLQSKRRCLWISTSRYNSWDKAMTYCNGQGGYLAHVYNDKDQKAILSWYGASAAKASGKRAYLGLHKSESYVKETDGSNIYWMTSTNKTLPFQMKDQFVGLIVNIDFWGAPWSIYGYDDYLTIDDELKFTYQIFPNYYAVCEQTTPRMKSVFNAFPANRRNPAPPIEEQTVSRFRDCAKLCAKRIYCMGFNLKSSPTAVTFQCQLVAVTVADFGANTLFDNQTVYYELSL